MRGKRKIAILFCAHLAVAGAMLAERPVERPPEGMGKYIVVLRYPEPRAPSEGEANPPRKIEPPDVAKLGGRVLQTAEKKLLIFLPRQAVAHLRADRNVAYVQRVWTGEPFDDWEDADLPDTSARVAAEAAELPPTWTTGEYVYDGSGNIASVGTDKFTYDAFGRLVTAEVKGVAETYTYDAFGNRTASTIEGQQVVVPVDPLSNRLANHAYDAAGNVTSGRGFTSYQYDSVGMPSKITTRDGQQKRIIYTPDDERIGVYMNQTLSRWTIRDFGGQVLREFQAHNESRIEPHPVDAMWLWVEDYVYAGGAAVGAEREAEHGGRLHFHRDHLGSTRMITTDSGRKLAIHDYAPFGRELTLPTQEMTETGRQPEPMKFTGHERDYHSWSTITGDDDDYLDYMHARYYNSVWGRFLSVDPVLDIRTALREPQQWNRYSYVVNNPLKYTDPDGKDKFMAWLLGDAFRDVSTWDALKGALSPGPMMTAINEGRQEWAEDHRAATNRFSPVPTSKTEVGMQMMMMGPIGKFIGTSFGKLGSVVANEAGKITGISGHAINQIITRGVSPALLKSVTSSPTVVLAQSGGKKLFLTSEGAVVLDKGGKIVTAYTKKQFDQKILDVLEQAGRAAAQ